MYRRRPFRGAPRRNLARLIDPLGDDIVFIPTRSVSPMKFSHSWLDEKIIRPSCTPEELTQIIIAPAGGRYQLPTTACDEVYPNIYLGDEVSALSIPTLKRLGITHVLNASQGKCRDFNMVNTSSSYYREAGIKFLGIEALDTTTYPIHLYFQRAADFIEDGVTAGKVMVHCRAGISRSATLVIAFLMIKRNMTAQDAVRRVRSHRSIIPNDGFLRQICDLNEKLSSERNALFKSRGIP